MPAVETINDDELILRRISQPDKKPKARHFKLREDETGLSCNRKILMTPAMMLSDTTFHIPKGSWVAEAVCEAIRKLGLKIEIEEVENSPGHCEIRTHDVDLDDVDVRDRLAELFSEVFRP